MDISIFRIYLAPNMYQNLFYTLIAKMLSYSMIYNIYYIIMVKKNLVLNTMLKVLVYKNHTHWVKHYWWVNTNSCFILFLFQLFIYFLKFSLKTSGGVMEGIRRSTMCTNSYVLGNAYSRRKNCTHASTRYTLVFWR